MCADARPFPATLFRQRGVTLVELILFIVIVSVGIVGILSVMNVATRSSADPMLRKQALAVAESLMEEVQSQAYTLCDPTDPNAAAAFVPGDCTTAQGIGPTAGQDRYAEPRFNNVGDYHGFNMNGIRRLEDGTAIAGLEGYNANVAIVAAAPGAPAATCLRITVTVAAPAAETVTLDSYRCLYAPRAVP